jgi:hypothetical protein
MKKGEYVMFMQGEWAPMNRIRNLVLNIYAPDPIAIQKASTKEIGHSIFNTMEYYLNYRLSKGANYKLPDL